MKLLTEPTVVADVQSFFAEHPIPQAAKTLDQVLERQRTNAALARGRARAAFPPPSADSPPHRCSSNPRATTLPGTPMKGRSWLVGW